MAAPSDLDRSAVRRQFDRRDRDAGAFLAREVESRMLQRLELVRLQPQRILDVGCGLGDGLRRLNARWPDAQAVGIDLSARRLARASALERPGLGAWAQSFARRLAGRGGPPHGRYVAADAHRLPLAGDAFDLIWSNLAFQWFDDAPAAIAEWYRVIRPGGLLMFSALGVDSLRELRAAGLAMPALPDLHDIGDALGAAGFADPVMDAERLTVTWTDAARMVGELRALGGDARRARRRGLSTPRQRAAMLAALPDRLGAAPPDRPFAISVEVIHGHAWCAARKRLPEGWAPLAFRPGVRPDRGP
jgi:malonyl-CoA O-methyltransferase